MRLDKELKKIWSRLLSVKQLSLIAKYSSGINKGRANVETSLSIPHVLLFHEKGHWTSSKLAFTNRFQWTLDLPPKCISLRHLRFGENHPVFLFHLSIDGPKQLRSTSPFHCGKDIYTGNIIWSDENIIFHWDIKGPDKKDEIVYHYR